MGKKIIGIGEYKIAGNPEVLVTLGLGSCVGVCIRDKRSSVGGMIHVMLPESKNDPNAKLSKYAYPGIKLMVDDMIKMGARISGMEAKIAGGAAMFETKGFDVGRRNVDRVKSVLRELGIFLVSEDTGGNRARSIEYHIKEGDLFIKKVGGKEKIEIIQI